MPTLFMMGGLPGAGKTTFSRYASQRTGAMHLNSVRLRRLLSLESHVVPREIGDPVVFATLDRDACSILEEGQDVFYDASHSTLETRRRSRTFAGVVGASAVLTWIDIPVDVAAQRATSRTPDEYTKQLQACTVYGYTLEPPMDHEVHIVLDGLRTVEEQFRNFQQQLHHV